jgi:transposase
MGYALYVPEVKAICVRLLLSGHSPATINKITGYPVSDRSYARWKSLFLSTRSVIRDPATYQPRGRPLLLKKEQVEFVLDILQADASLYLDELQSQIVDEAGVLLSRSAVYDLLIKRLGQTLKVARTVHPAQCPIKRAAYSIEVSVYPPEYLVFVGKSPLITLVFCIDRLNPDTAFSSTTHRRKCNLYRHSTTIEGLGPKRQAHS